MTQRFLSLDEAVALWRHVWTLNSPFPHLLNTLNLSTIITSPCGPLCHTLSCTHSCTLPSRKQPCLSNE